MSKPTAAQLRWCGKQLWQAADAFVEAIRRSDEMNPDIWTLDDKVEAIDGALVAASVAERMGYKPAPTAPDSAPAS